MLKKIIAWTLLVTLTATVAIGGTLAYLTDRDSEANVFTVGDVTIDLEEDFDQGAELIPGVEIEKKPTITNTGKNDAWVWATIAVPGKLAGVIDFVNPGADPWKWDAVQENVTINGGTIPYSIYTVLYNEKLAKDAETSALFEKVSLKSTVDIDPNGDWYTVDAGVAESLGWKNSDGNPVIYVSAYAIQTEGFDTVQEAYEEYGIQWGDNGSEYPEPGTLVMNEEELKEAIAAGKPAILGADIALTSALDIEQSVNVNLNGYTLTSVGLNLKQGGSIQNGTVNSAADTQLVPHLRVSGGTLTMDNVTVDVEHVLNKNVYWSEATGFEVANATAILNDCNISIHNGVGAQWVYSYAISLNNGKVTMNGGTVTANCVAGTAANGPTNPNAISAMGAESVATMNGVTITATYYATTVNGHLTINTTDRNVTSANVVDNRGGSHTLNYIN